MNRRTQYIGIMMLIPALLNATPTNEKICFESVEATPHETVKSEPITVSHLKAPKKVKLLGRGIYLLNGKVIKKKESYVRNGDKIQVVLQADSAENANVRSTLMVDQHYDVFTVTTKHQAKPIHEDINPQCVVENLH